MNPRVNRLPVLVISAHSRCNARCVMCDIWRTTESVRFTMQDLERQFGDIGDLGVEWVVFTGGEPLLNRDLFPMAMKLRSAGIRVTVLSSGLLLGRFARELAAHVDEVIVSLDGPRGVHDRIRGVIGAFDQLATGVRSLRSEAPGYPVSARCTIQRANHHAILETARAAEGLDLNSISFLAADVSSQAFAHASSNRAQLSRSLLLTAGEIDELERQFRALLDDPVSAIVAENRAKLGRIVDYFRAFAAGAEPAAPVCNAPWVSAVLGHDGSVRPCFFHPPIGDVRDKSLKDALNSEAALEFRRSLDVASNPVCRRCVCSLHRPVPAEAAARRNLCA